MTCIPKHHNHKATFNALSMYSKYINHTPSPFSSSQHKQQQPAIKNPISRKVPPSKFSVPRHQKVMMISARKLIKMARKWQRVAALGTKRLSFPTTSDEVSTSDHSSELAEKGHFIVYTTDKVRFAFPIAYLNSLIFRELLRMSEEEFGLPNDGPITLPCDSQFMGYVTSLMQKKASKDVEQALLLSVAAYRYSSSYYLHQQQTNQHMVLCGC